MKLWICLAVLILLGGNSVLAAGKSFENKKLIAKNFSDLPPGLQQKINESVSARSIG
jgi:hypothetical protein